MSHKRRGSATRDALGRGKCTVSSESGGFMFACALDSEIPSGEK